MCVSFLHASCVFKNYIMGLVIIVIVSCGDCILHTMVGISSSCCFDAHTRTCVCVCVCVCVCTANLMREGLARSWEAN